MLPCVRLCTSAKRSRLACSFCWKELIVGALLPIELPPAAEGGGRYCAKSSAAERLTVLA